MSDARTSEALDHSPVRGGPLARVSRPWRRRGLALSFAALLGAVAPARSANACSIFNPICWVEEAVDFISDTLQSIIDITVDIVTFDPGGLFDDFQELAEDVLCGNLTLFNLAGGNIAEAVHNSCTSVHPIEPDVLVKLGTYFKSSFETVTIHENCDFSSPTAITFGENIYFGKTGSLSNYHPLCTSTDPCACRDGMDNRGFALLAHELTHVIQYRKEGFGDFVCKYFLECGFGPWFFSDVTGAYEMDVGVSCSFEQAAYVYQAMVFEDVRRDGDGIFTCPLGECDDEAHEWNGSNFTSHSCDAEILRCGLVVEGAEVPDYCGSTDNCPNAANSDQADSDGDGRGDACDTCALALNPFEDLDDDCVPDTTDNCPCAADIVSAIEGVCDSGSIPPGTTPPGACFPVVGCAAFANTNQADNDADGAGDVCDPDDDNDGLTDVDEVSHGTDPFDPDSDDDGLTDGDEVHVHHTNPLDADSDDDGLTDGDEVNVHHTDPLDADSDDDLLDDGLEVSVGTNPLDADSDDDGIIDGKDVEFLQTTIEAPPASAFKDGSSGNRTAMLSQLDAVEEMVASGDVAGAIAKLTLLRRHVDGCGSAADNNDWVVDCAAQIEIRDRIDLLISNLST